MSKLFKLKEWVTIKDAARHLGQIVNEPICEADILQLALDRQIKLTVDFPNRAKAKLGRIVPYKDAPIIEASLFDENKNLFYAEGYFLKEVKAGEVIEDETPFLVFDDDVVTIDGLWDLTMIGSEQLDILDELQKLIGGPPITLINLKGTFLSRPDGTWASLQHKTKDCTIEDTEGNIITIKSEYYPAGGLDGIGNLVVRVSEIMALQAKLNGEKDEKPVGRREETTYLNIIGGLLQLMLSTTQGGRRGSIYDSQNAIIEALGSNFANKPGLAKATLEQKFADAKRSIIGS